jgi:hypothetical protein
MEEEYGGDPPCWAHLFEDTGDDADQIEVSGFPAQDRYETDCLPPDSRTPDQSAGADIGLTDSSPHPT